MPFAYSVLVAHLAISQITVLVTRDDAALTPLNKAAVSVIRGSSRLDGVPTGIDGRAFLNETGSYTSSDTLQVKKPPYQTHSEPWPANLSPGEEFHVRLRLIRKTCKYTVQKPVYEIRDGVTLCKVVYEVLERECPPPGVIEYQLPVDPPPSGYKYVFAYAITRYDAERQQYAHKPYWRLALACEQVGQSYAPAPQPCGCQ